MYEVYFLSVLSIHWFGFVLCKGDVEFSWRYEAAFKTSFRSASILVRSIRKFLKKKKKALVSDV
jgi:hypothetical protein